MLDSERTVLTVTVFLLVSTRLSMARIAIVSVSMAEPKGDGAAIPALKVNIVCSVLLADLLARTHDIC